MKKAKLAAMSFSILLMLGAAACRASSPKEEPLRTVWEEAYVFPLSEEQARLLDGFNAGGELTVTYKNGLPSPDNVSAEVVAVQKAE